MSRVRRFIDSTQGVIVLLGALGVILVGIVVALSLAYSAQSKSTQNAKNLAKATQQESSDNKMQLAKIQDALCGTTKDPGLLPTLASAPKSVQTAPLGIRLVRGAQHAQSVIQCSVLKH